MPFGSVVPPSPRMKPPSPNHMARVAAILAKNGHFLRAATSEVRPVPQMAMFVKRWNEFT
jgi:hypothetical protein